MPTCSLWQPRDHHRERIAVLYPWKTVYGDDDDGIPDHHFVDTESFWANYSASDIMNLTENEGPEDAGPPSSPHRPFRFEAPHLFSYCHARDGQSILDTFLSLIIISEKIITALYFRSQERRHCNRLGAIFFLGYLAPQ
ncbi:hypothetical protein V8C42DRAFT_318707 [Trichoderma barbatum]